MNGAWDRQDGATESHPQLRSQTESGNEVTAEKPGQAGGCPSRLLGVDP